MRAPTSTRSVSLFTRPSPGAGCRSPGDPRSVVNTKVVHDASAPRRAHAGGRRAAGGAGRDCRQDDCAPPGRSVPGPRHGRGGARRVDGAARPRHRRRADGGAAPTQRRRLGAIVALAATVCVAGVAVAWTLAGRQPEQRAPVATAAVTDPVVAPTPTPTPTPTPRAPALRADPPPTAPAEPPPTATVEPRTTPPPRPAVHRTRRGKPAVEVASRARPVASMPTPAPVPVPTPVPRASHRLAPRAACPARPGRAARAWSASTSRARCREP